VTRYGTAAKAASLKRNDLAGKTGTTNDSHDAWFAGYGGGLVGIAWMGFDQPHNLGEKETGGGLALPIWITCMQAALKGAPDVLRDPPPGVVSIGGEYYLEEYPPGLGVASLGLDDALPADQQKKQDEVKDQIF
jgi:penicillin-binding protein 1A